MSEEPQSTEYSASSITVLEGLEAVRVRPAMYIGDTDVRGMHHLIWEVVDNSVDEALAGHATKCRVILAEDGSVRVEDDGRGIPISIHPKEGVPAVEVVLTKLHAGGKFDDQSYKVSGGLHGVGVSCVNALSVRLEVQVHHGGKIHRMVFARGKKISELEVIGDTDHTGTTIIYKPDPEIFTSTEVQYEIVQKRLKETAYLMGTHGLRLELHDDRTNTEESFEYPEGLKAFVDSINKNRTALHPEVMHFSKDVASVDDPGSEYGVELALQYTDAYQETVHTFVNNINTHGGGTHLAGMKAGLTRTLNTYAKREKLVRDSDTLPSGDDFREGLTAILSLKVPDPQFEGQTKDKLGNREAQGIVESAVSDLFSTYLEENPAVAKTIIFKAVRAREAREAARKARDLVRRKSALASGNLPGKLADCQSNNREETELYIVEGDSAGGPAKMGRDRRIQAILPIKGKILNVERARLDKMLSHTEIQLIIAALGCGIAAEFDLAKVRYGKTIIMTDADVDGSHIRTLLLTFFFRQMQEIIEAGMLYIACPPLYKVTKGKNFRYIVDEKGLREYLVDLGVVNTTLRDDNADREWKDSELREITETLRELMDLTSGAIPNWAELPYAQVIDRWDGEKLPGWWARADRVDNFFETREEYENFLELRSAMVEGDLQIYSGPDSKMPLSEAHVQAMHLQRTEAVGKVLTKLEGLGLVLRGGGSWSLKSGSTDRESRNIVELAEAIQTAAQSGIDIQRYKGLGEMNADQLWDSTMDPFTRTLYQVTLEDALEADEIFTILMSDGVEARREYIEKYALEITNLDI
ncbi:MAG: DNA gyrase subunit B [Planctomycetota bacterium]|jgi:DNA gyrase subunit B